MIKSSLFGLHCLMIQCKLHLCHGLAPHHYRKLVAGNTHLPFQPFPDTMSSDGVHHISSVLINSNAANAQLQRVCLHGLYIYL